MRSGDGLDRDRLGELVHGHFGRTLSDAERRELEDLLRNHEEARRDFLLSAALEEELFVLHETPPQNAAAGSAPDSSVPADSPTRRLAKFRTSRRFHPERSAPSLLPTVAAAGLLLGFLVLVFVLGSARPGGELAGPGRSHGKAEGIHPAIPGTPAVGPVSAPSGPPAVEEERIRSEAAKRLADVERRRTLLDPSSPQKPGESKVNLVLLDEEKRRIEAEMNAAIEQARRSQKEKAPATVPVPPGGGALEDAVAEHRIPGATLERVEGEGFVVRKEVRIPAREGVELGAGEGLETAGRNARLVVRFADRTRLELRGESSVSGIFEGGAREFAPGKLVLVTRGGVAAEVTKQPAGRPLVLRTPHAEATVLGTSLRILVDPGEKGATRLEVQEGRVHFTRLLEKKASVDVSAGHFAVAAQGVALLSRAMGGLRTGLGDKPAVVSVTLLNADSGRPFLQFDPLEDGTVLSLADLPTRNLNIQVTTSPATVGCVVLSWDGTIRIEGRAPYLLGGNTQDGRPIAWTPAPGDHTLVVTPYSGPAAANRREGTGSAGSPVTIRLRVR